MSRDPANPLTTFLATTDAPCPNCSYNLRGLTTDRCPECSQPLTLQLALAHPRFGAWITCVLALASVGGLFSIGLFIVLAISVAEGPPTGTEAWFLIAYPASASFLCIPPCMFLVTKRGRRWLRERTAVAWVVLAFVTLPAALVLAWTIWLITEM